LKLVFVHKTRFKCPLIVNSIKIHCVTYQNTANVTISNFVTSDVTSMNDTFL
jgi:hypothetical protein